MGECKLARRYAVEGVSYISFDVEMYITRAYEVHVGTLVKLKYYDNALCGLLSYNVCV